MSIMSWQAWICLIFIIIGIFVIMRAVERQTTPLAMVGALILGIACVLDVLAMRGPMPVAQPCPAPALAPGKPYGPPAGAVVRGRLGALGGAAPQGLQLARAASLQEEPALPLAGRWPAQGPSRAGRQGLQS